MRGLAAGLAGAPTASRVHHRGARARRQWLAQGSVDLPLPGTTWTDRRWHPVSIDLPANNGAPLEVVVTLSTRVAAGAGIENAWALFGEPRLEWPRSPAGDARRSPTFASRIRSSGLRSSLELLTAAGITTPDAEAYPRWVARQYAQRSGPRSVLAADVAALPYQPLVSVIMPVYNTDPQWLRACVESVRRQAYPNWELCLCDDASTLPGDSSALREYASDPRITVTRLAKNGGISAASNAALALATGDFVALLDHDDELAPDALFQVVRYLNDHPDADVIYTDEDKLDRQGASCEPYLQARLVAGAFPVTCMYTCHLMVTRRRLVEEVGRFATGYEGAQDYDLLLRIMRADDAHPPRPARPLSLAQAAGVDRQRGGGQTVGARRGTAGARGLRAADGHRRRRAARRRLPGLFRVRRPDSSASRSCRL